MARTFSKSPKGKTTLTLTDSGLEKALEKAIRKSPEKAARAVMGCLQDLARKSMQRAPLESGDLRNNCHANIGGVTIFHNQQPLPIIPPVTPNVIGSVGYSLPYAVRQHEELSYKHDRTDGRRIYKATRYNTANGGSFTTYSAVSTVNVVPGGEAKYLERPFDENKADYAKHIQKAVTDTLE